MKQLVILLITSCLTTNSGFTISGPLSQSTLPSFIRKSVATDVVGLINKPHHLWKTTNQHLFPTTTNNDEETTNNNNEETILANESGAMNEAEMKKNNWLSTNTKTLKNLALSLLLVVCLTFAPLVQQSLAVESGGRMGGSFSRQQSSSPSYSRSYSRPSPSIRSYSYSSPTVIRPYYSPFGYGGYGGGVTVVRRGPSFFDVIVFAGVAFTLFSVFSKSSSSSTLDWPSKSSTSALGPGFSVIQLSVAVNVPKRDSPSSVLSKLDYLAETAQTDSRVGLQNLVSEVSLELLRQTQSVVSVSSSYSHYNEYNKAQRDYNKLSIRERSKFQRETGKFCYIFAHFKLFPGTMNLQSLF